MIIIILASFRKIMLVKKNVDLGIVRFEILYFYPPTHENMSKRVPSLFIAYQHIYVAIRGLHKIF